MLELVYTSAKTGLLPGRSGFSTVACTIGMPPNLISILENLSVYKPLFDPTSSRSGENPISQAFRKMRFGNTEYFIISRTSFAGVDYSGRTNKLSHHIVFANNDPALKKIPNGPAAAALEEGNFISCWDSEPKWIRQKTLPRYKTIVQEPAVEWGEKTGDPGWAGVVAEKFIRDPGTPFYLEYEPGTPVSSLIKLIEEILVVLPEEYRVDFTFDTYAFQMNSGTIDCFFRAVPSGTQITETIRLHQPHQLISLCTLQSIPDDFRGSPLVLKARNGCGMKREQKFQQEPDVSETLLLEPIPELKPDLSPEKRKSSHDVPELRPEQEQPVNSAGQTFKKKTILILCICFFVFILLSAEILYICFSRLWRKQTATEEVPIQVEQSGSQVPSVQISPVPEHRPSVPVHKKKPAPGPKKDTKKNTLPKQNQVMPSGSLGPEERIPLYLAWGTREKITLPPRLKASDRVSAEITRIGIATGINLKDHMHSSGNSFLIFGVKKTADGIGNLRSSPDPDHVLKITVSNGELIISPSKPGEMSPKLEDIRMLHFHSRSGKTSWNCKLSPDDVKSIRKGKFVLLRWKLKYTPSEMEQKFGNRILFCLETGFNGKKEEISHLPDLSEPVSNWNALIDEFKRTKKEYDLVRKQYEKKCAETPKSSREAVKKILSQDIDKRPKDAPEDVGNFFTYQFLKYGKIRQEDESLWKEVQAVWPKFDINKNISLLCWRYRKLQKKNDENKRRIGSSSKILTGLFMERYPAYHPFGKKIERLEKFTREDEKKYEQFLQKKLVRTFNSEVFQ